MSDLSRFRGKRALVCGGRTYSDGATLARVLDTLAPDSIVEGGADGADWMSRMWALERSFAGHDKADTFAPRHEDIRRWGYPRACRMRNARMLAEGRPEYVLAFPGGRGTDDMVAKAKAAGVPVLRVKRDGVIQEDTDE